MIGGERSADRRSWWPWLGLWTLVGLGIRVASLFGPGRTHRPPGGDAYYFHNAANLLVEGKGFINPFTYLSTHPHQVVQTALWPPLFVFVLAIPSAIGLKTFLAHRVWCCIVGAAGIVVCGYAGREIGGRRVGLVAAFIVAVYPNIWMSDELALSEALAPLLAGTVLLLAYRFWKEPGARRAIWLGLSLGVAMLGRDELALLVLFLLVPLVLLAKALSWRRRFAVLGVGLLAAGAVVAPWVGYNMSRFQDPVFISNGLGVTLDSANCDCRLQRPLRGVLVPALRPHGREPGHQPPRRRVGPGGRGTGLRGALHQAPRGPALPGGDGPARAGLRLLPPAPADQAGLDGGDPAVSLGARRAGDVLRPRRALASRGWSSCDAVASRSSRCSPSGSMSSCPCCSPSATPATAARSRWPWRCWRR